MKKYIYILMAGAALMMASCSDFTDIQPKGKNLLSTTDELAMLLNQVFQYGSTADRQEMAGDLIYELNDIPTLLSQTSKTRNVIIFSWDEADQDKMEELTASDDDYSNDYGYIGTIANPILSRIDDAEGDESTKIQLKCEALTIRAYYHWLLVNKFAKAYNPSTAANDPGIAYLYEDQDLESYIEKSTVQEVYDNILADINEAIELDGLPTVPINRMRMCKASAYAVKAWVLISMQRFDEAEEAAKQSLALNGTVNDYNQMLTVTYGYMIGGTYPIIYRPRLECEEDLFFVYNIEFFDMITPEAWDFFEEGHASRDKMSNDLMMYDYLMSYASMLCGLDGYVMTYDLSSGWNSEGLKTTHMYLIVAEAEIHNGNYDAAMQALDAIRVNRIDPDIYQPLQGTVTTEADAIYHLKQTSHGENIYSIYNFMQRKRWNQVSGWEETLTRDLNGTQITLTPDSPLWIFPFPMNATAANPNLTQNYSVN